MKSTTHYENPYSYPTPKSGDLAVSIDNINRWLYHKGSKPNSYQLSETPFNPGETCLVLQVNTGSQNDRLMLVLTSRGKIGWVYPSWIKTIQSQP